MLCTAPCVTVLRNRMSQVPQAVHSKANVLHVPLQPQDFVFCKEVRLGSYAPTAATLPPAAIVAAKAMAVDPRAEPRYAERVPYVVRVVLRQWGDTTPPALPCLALSCSLLLLLLATVPRSPRFIHVFQRQQAVKNGHCRTSVTHACGSIRPLTGCQTGCCRSTWRTPGGPGCPPTGTRAAGWDALCTAAACNILHSKAGAHMDDGDADGDGGIHMCSSFDDNHERQHCQPAAPHRLYLH